MNCRTITVLNVLFICIITLAMCAQTGILDLLPSADEAKGWQEDEAKILRTSQEMSDYMNGGAGLYFSYDFIQMGLKRFVNDAGLELVVELYEMVDSESAYGVLSFDLTGTRVDIGTIGMYDRGLLRFWRGSYYCRIQMWEGYADNREMILKTGRDIVRRIGDVQDRIPEMVNLLPEEGLERASVHYFFHNVPLNNFYYISNGDIFRFQDGARAVMGRYFLPGDESFYVMVIHYSDDSLLTESYRNFIHAYFGTESSESIAADEYQYTGMVDEKKYGAAQREGPYLVVILDAGSSIVCSEYMEKVRVQINR